MSFRFRILHIWKLPEASWCHAIGLLEDGKLLTPGRAAVDGDARRCFAIESMVLGGGKPWTGLRNEFTIVLRGEKAAYDDLVGATLIPSTECVS